MNYGIHHVLEMYRVSFCCGEGIRSMFGMLGTSLYVRACVRDFCSENPQQQRKAFVICYRLCHSVKTYCDQLRVVLFALMLVQILSRH